MIIVGFVLGLVLLVVGAEWLVRGASRVAMHFGISPLVIGLTVVAYGTSAPEFATSLFATYQGNVDIAVGNVVGSNLFNVLFILGISACVTPLTVHTQLVRWDVPLMIAVSVLVYPMAINGSISRAEGIFLFVGVLAYTGFLIVQSRRSKPANQAEFADALPPIQPANRWALLFNMFWIVAGLVALVAGSKLLVDGATSMAKWVGMSDLIIGLTIVAAGTSLPELATSVMAAYRGQRDIAVGNVVGSNIFNILAVLGASAVVSPTGIRVSSQAIQLDIPAMIAVAAACLPVFYSGFVVSRANGVMFIGYYIAYVLYLVLKHYGHPIESSFQQLMMWGIIPVTWFVILGSAANSWKSRRSSQA